MKVLMYPASVKKNDNPFINIIADSLREKEVTVDDPLFAFRYMGYSALHLHWLEGIFWGRLAKRSNFVSKLKADRLIRIASRFSEAGKPVVWTLHNLHPHESLPSDKAELFSKFLEELSPHISDVIFMNPSLGPIFAETFPMLSHVRHRHIPHPHFRTFFSEFSTKDFEMESSPTIAFDTPKLACVGMIRTYKGIPALIECLKSCNHQFHLVIAGSGPRSACQEVHDAINGDSRFSFVNKQLSHKEVFDIITNSTATIFNFTSILNSGSILTSLSLSKPVICPNFPSLSYLQNSFGSDWISTFEAPLTAPQLTSILAATKNKREVPCPMDACSPNKVAQMHIEVYRSTL
jgi:beta-1,4-mannosyltransferase